MIGIYATLVKNIRILNKKKTRNHEDFFIL